MLQLFSYGLVADIYQAHEGFSDTESFISAELDEIFDGKASETFIESFLQDWSQEEFVRGSYSFYGTRLGLDFQTIASALREPIDDRIFLAGEAVPADGDLFGYVHTAAFSGQDAATRAMELLGESPRFRFPRD